MELKITNTFNENGKTLQEIMEQFLIIYYNENIKTFKNKGLCGIILYVY